jgi:hypothetical protein
MNVRKVGAVKHGRNTEKRSASEHGSVASGSIDGSLSPEWYRNRQASPFTIHDDQPDRHRRVAAVKDRLAEP